MYTYEIRTFSSNRWTTESRCYDRDEALKKANVIAGDRSLDGVKVVEETYDENEGLFREKTVFSYFKQEDKVFNPALKKPKETPKPPPPPPLRKTSTDSRAWLLVMALVFSLAGNIGLAVWMGGPDGSFDFAGIEKMDGIDRNKLIIYDLPAVTMNYGPEHESRAVKIRLGIELKKRGDVRDIESQLSNIISNVANELSQASEEQLSQSKGLNSLRDSLHRDIQSAAGDTPVEGVLFKEIVVF